MIEAKLTWGQGAAAQVEAAGWERLQRGVVFFHTKLLEAINVSNPRPYTTPSRPGEPPRKRTGFGQRNVVYEMDRAAGTARVGVALPGKYLLFLELGTRTILPRPWLLATLARFEQQIRVLVGG